MTKYFAPAPATIRALPYTGGDSTRFKAEPTRLTPLAGKIMMASGALSTRRRVVSVPLGRIAGAIAFLGLSAAFFLFDGQQPNRARMEALAPAAGETQPLPVILFVENPEPIEQRAAGTERDAADAVAAIDSQDRFEIARFIRLSAIVQPSRQKAEQVRRTRPVNGPAS